MKQEHDGCVFVNTVADNKSSYTNEDYRKAVLARDLLLKLGRPSVQDFIRIVQNKHLTNCPVTVADIQAGNTFLVLMLAAYAGRPRDVVHTRLILGIPPYPLTSWPNIDM
jgi:hypothetical protein